MDTKNTIKTLSQSLLDEVKKIMKKEKNEKSEKGESEADEKREHCSEALKGDQHKIDANKNGKVDAHDFKLLRKKKGVAETYTALKTGEEISEEEVEEAVKNPYAVGMAAAMKSTGDKPPLKKSTIIKGHEIAKKIKEETEEVSEEAEQIDELSRKTMSSYVKKAIPSMRGLEDASDRAHQKGHETYKAGATKTSDKFFKLSDRHLKKSNKRGEGINTALNKLAKEEVEQIDELSKGTLTRYANRALNDVRNSNQAQVRWQNHKADGYHGAHPKTGMPVHKTAKEMEAEHERIAKNREQGVRTAIKKLAKEEIELTQEEIDRLDAIMADLDEARGRPPKEGSEAWKKRQEAGAAEQDEPRQHPIQQLERIKRDMRGGGDFKHKDGSTHHLTGSQASKLLDKYHGMKPAEKESMQKEIHANHAGLKKHL